MADAVVYFFPVGDIKAFEKKHKNTPLGMLDSDGKFKMGINGFVQGIPPGKYRAMIVLIDDTAAEALPGRYMNLKQSPWEITIPTTGNTDIVLRMEN